ncbi:MAG: aminotransferase class V-fold PLP-dependent enzyme [Crocinitomicaceae bacterium]
MANLKEQFLLNPNYKHLNHGSFGACPKPIFEDYQKWQLALERDPVDFFVNKGNEQLQRSKEALGKYINCHPDNLVYTTNPTYAINIIAKSLNLSPGDEILATDQEYGALDKTWKYYCDKAGATYVQQHIQLPVTSKEQMIDNFFAGYSDRTKAIFISQITSMTALIFPVKEICERAKSLGLLTIVDGAHVPGHITLDLSELKADIYTGACHKWMMTPKGCSFLFARPEVQNDFDPVIISWGYDAEVPGKSKFLDYHQLQGTRDYSAFLTVPESIRFMEKHDWWEVSRKNKELLRKNYVTLCDLFGATPLCPITDEFLGQIASVPLPISDPAPLKKVLFEKYKIEIPVFKLRDQVYLRLSTQAYVSQEDIDALIEALKEVQKDTAILSS